MKPIRVAFFLVVSALGIASAAAVSYPLFQNSSRILSDAFYAFDAADYGTALRLAEEAKVARKREVSECLSVLDQALRPLAVQNAGDSVADVRAVLEEREVFDALGLIDHLESLMGAEFFGDSVAAMRSYIERKSVFPETEYLFARVYEFEGEYELATSYYMEAWEHSDVLDVPDMKYDILYDMANLAYNFSHEDDCEKALLLVLADDPFFSDKAFSGALISSVERGYSADRIFDLYRTGCYRSIPAFFRLTELYVEQGRDEEAFSAALFGVLTAFTRMNEVLEERETEFRYTTLADFFLTAAKHDDVMEWGVENGFWRCLYRLSDLGLRLYPGNASFGRELLSVITDHAPESYWRQLALSRAYSYQ